MGNDIKLPSNQRKELLLENKKTLDNEAKEHLSSEIDKILDQVSLINNKINKVEYNLKLINRNICYYKELIADMSSTLHQLKIEQVNANLIHENYVERAKWYLSSLTDFQAQVESNIASELYPISEQPLHEAFFETNIAGLQASVDDLTNKIAENDKFINERTDKYHFK